MVEYKNFSITINKGTYERLYDISYKIFMAPPLNFKFTGKTIILLSHHRRVHRKSIIKDFVDLLVSTALDTLVLDIIISFNLGFILKDK